MGLRLTLRLFKGLDDATMRHLMEQAAYDLKGSIRWNEPGKGLEDLRLSRNGTTHSLYLPYQKLDYPFCEQIGLLSGLPWLELRIQEGSIWDYSLYLGRENMDN